MKFIYDCVHKEYTPWSACLLQIINTPEFQRLKRIKQLGACHHVFPGAVHTRFEHSLGVGYLAKRMIESLQSKQPELEINDNTILTFQLAGLCHDLGHGPISHGFDHFLSSLGIPKHISCHEHRSVDMLRYIVHKHKVHIAETIVDNACELIYPMTHHLPIWWYQMIANEKTGIDVDKFDYLLRDTHMTGMMCNDIDVKRFIDYARVMTVHNTSSTHQELCYPEKLQFDVNQLFITRHRLHAQVYQHPTVRAYEMMYTDILRILQNMFTHLRQGTHSIEWLLEWTDDMFTSQSLTLYENTSRCSSLHISSARRVLDCIDLRKHYKMVKEIRCANESDFCDTYSLLINQSKPQLKIDKVNIGYTTNPFYNVLFYTKKGTYISTSVSRQTSAIFPYHSRDYILRVYTITQS